MREAKFNFAEFFPREQQPEKEEKLIVSLGRKTGILLFSPRIVRAHDMENKLVKFYYDSEKNAIAWKYFNRATQEQLEGMKLAVKNKNGCVQMGIRKLLKRFNKLPEGNLSGLEVREYKGSLIDKDSFYYVILEKSKQ